MRGEAACAQSGTALALGDRVVRITKCRHFLLESEMKALVLGLGEEEEKEEESEARCGGFARLWEGNRAEAEAGAGGGDEERLRCPKCRRHMRVDVRD